MLASESISCSLIKALTSFFFSAGSPASSFAGIFVEEQKGLRGKEDSQVRAETAVTVNEVSVVNI